MVFIKAALLISALTASFAMAQTNVHVNSGCIDIDTAPFCAGDYTTVGGGKATIYARFNSANKAKKALPGCILKAKWPTNYGDVYFGANNCLYDASGNIIDNQCCNPGTGGKVKKINPYY